MKTHIHWFFSLLPLVAVTFGAAAQTLAPFAAPAVTNGSVLRAERAAPLPQPAPEEQLRATEAAQVNLRAATSNTVGQTRSGQRINAVSGGGRADFGLLTAFFPADAAGGERFHVTMPDGRTLSFQPRFLAWHDISTGERWLLAQVTNRIGLIMPSGQVLYTNAFDAGVRADLRLRYGRNLLEQDVILRERPALPEGAVVENLRLEVWTEWFDFVPAKRQAQTIDLRRGQSDAAPALVADEEADFRVAKIGGGSAFTTSEPDDKFPVAKTWARVDERDWLIETVDYQALKTRFDALGGAGGKRTAKASASEEELIRSLAASPGASASLPPSSLIDTAQRAGQEAGVPALLLALADLPETPGVVVDFAILACVPVPSGIISWWPAGGNAEDVIAASGNDGAMYHSATYGSGKVGQSFVFAGLYEEHQGYVEIPNTASLNPPNGLTVEAWIYFTEHSSGWNMPIVSKDGGNGRQYLLTKTDADVIRAHVGIAGDTFRYTDGEIVLQPETWHHVAMTYSAADSALKIYVNGELDVAASVSGSLLTTSEPLYLGGAPYWGYYWSGGIDEASIYDRALSASEIGLIYEAGAAGKINPNCVIAPSDIAVWLPGDLHPYSVSSGHTATLQNGATYASAVASHGFLFDGSNDGVTVTNDPALGFDADEDFSLEVWLNAEVHSTTYGVMSVLGKRYAPNSWTALGWELFLVNGQPGLQLADSSGAANYIASGDLRDGGWHHVVVTVDRDSSTGGHIYVDGSQVLEFNPSGKSGDLSNSDPLRLGVHPQTGLNCFYKGIIDEATVYRRELSSTEVSGLFQAGGAGKCRADADNDGIADWWEMRHFGNLDQGAYDDYDEDGQNNLTEYSNGSDPNTIVFRTHYPDFFVTNRTVTGSCAVQSGFPAYLAVLVNSTNLAAATWMAYDSNFTAMLPDTDGVQIVVVALRGLALNLPSDWDETEITLDRVPAMLAITNPVSATATRPYLQLQGFSDEPLATLAYSLTNVLGLATNQPVSVVDQEVDTNRFEFTTNYFQAYDVDLAEGENLITLRVSDLAGNVTTTNITVTLDYASATNAPIMHLLWPTNEMHVSGDSFYVRGVINDETARVTAQLVDTNGMTNFVAGVVERNGMFWIEDLPLEDGTNTLTLLAVDAAENLSATNLTVVKSAVTLSITSTPQGESLYTPHATVSGTVSDANYAVTVNGVAATVDEYGNWTAENVSVLGRGTATFDAVAALGGGGGSSTVASSVAVEMPYFIGTISHNTGKGTASPATTSTWMKTYNGQFELGGDGTFKQTYKGAVSASWSSTGEGSGSTKFLWSDADPQGTSQTDNGPIYTLVENPDFPVKSVPDQDVNYVTESYYYVTHYFGRRVRHRWDVYPDSFQRVTLSARTKQKLYTGGKAEVGRKNLFRVTASAVEYGKPVQFPWYFTPGDPVDSGRIRVMGKTPGADGSVYLVLPDNAEQDATVTVRGAKHYNAGVGASKHKLVHLTECTALTNPDNTRTTVGVGEYVNFSFDQPINMSAPETPQWETTAGSVDPTTGEGTKFTAPSNDVPATVTVHVRDVKLKTKFGVREPSGVNHAQITNTNLTGSGFVGAIAGFYVTFAPTSVSFSRVEIMEVAMPATAVSGNFTNFTEEQLHHSNFGAGDWVGLDCNNSLQDEAGFGPVASSPPIWASSGLTWECPAKWKIDGGPTNSMSGWTQTISIDSALKTTVGKFGRSLSRTVNGEIFAQ